MCRREVYLSREGEEKSPKSFSEKLENMSEWQRKWMLLMIVSVGLYMILFSVILSHPEVSFGDLYDNDGCYLSLIYLFGMMNAWLVDYKNRELIYYKLSALYVSIHITILASFGLLVESEGTLLNYHNIAYIAVIILFVTFWGFYAYNTNSNGIKAIGKYL